PTPNGTFIWPTSLGVGAPPRPVSMLPKSACSITAIAPDGLCRDVDLSRLPPPLVSDVSPLRIVVQPPPPNPPRSLKARSRPAGPKCRPAGLSGVLVHSVAVVPGSGTVFAGTTEGLLRSRGGGSWVRLISTRDVWDVVVAPGGREILAAENLGYADVSHDGGL